jgi:hypothetical protein
LTIDLKKGHENATEKDIQGFMQQVFKFRIPGKVSSKGYYTLQGCHSGAKITSADKNKDKDN